MKFLTQKMEHQQKAYEKLSDIKVGALYMDMGTGKTRTALELAVDRLMQGKTDCILWLCPVSVKKTIEEEIQKHIDNISYELIEPDRINDWKAYIYVAGIESVSQSDRMIYRLYELIRKRNCFVVVDESSLIKNWLAKRTQRIIKLSKYAKYKLILNGTPISNTEQDLFAQWYFLDYRILGYRSFWSFAANHLEYDEHIKGRVVRVLNTDYLTRKIAPYTYQVTKEECLDLPEKTYSTRYFNMTENQRYIYYMTMDDILMNIDYSEFESYTIFKLFTALQKVVCGITDNNNLIFKNSQNNPRMQVLLEQISNTSHREKIIIWCKFQHEIDTIKKVLQKKYGNQSVAEYWGELSEGRKNEELDKFKNQARFLVANKRCAAFGLNLQFCSCEIFYSNDFSWYTRSQAEDRCHRAGQKKNVHIVDIICNNSIDEKILDCLWNKENLVDSFRRQIDKFKNKEDLERWVNNAKSVFEQKCV